TVGGPRLVRPASRTRHTASAEPHNNTKTQTDNSGASQSEEPGTHDWASGSQPDVEYLTQSWVPGSSLREAPE
ncbi:hypothetical protein, partial [Bosea sp. MMO-172]|uniref:hypothetical protein n=1 Tax=Bosea sp. MMO-172 TaxID=3127885 RepID=UPI0030192718